jgi:ADP-heptose:LPS heptosyltransferase
LELGPHLSDFADTASVLKQLDLVIMTDSSVAHLAGSLGCPVWNLLPCHAYWLYLSERDDSPWYPSMTLIRQPEPGDWDSVFKEATARLRDAVSASNLRRQRPPRETTRDA